MENSYQLLRQLKFSVNSESHSTAEWVSIMKDIQYLAAKIESRINMSQTPFLDRVDIKEDNHEQSKIE